MVRTPHAPQRSCVICRERRPQQELHRFHRDATGQWQPDPSRKAGGRGAWLCETCRHQATGRELRRFFRNQASRIERLLRSQGCGSAPDTEVAGGING